MIFAVGTGLIFTKFSHPTARVLFSRVMVVGDFEGQPALQVRMANEQQPPASPVTGTLRESLGFRS